MPVEPRSIDLTVDYHTEIEPNLGRVIGHGGYGRVYEALWRGRRVAVKLLLCDSQGHYDSLLHEVELYSRLAGCEHVVRLYGACLADKQHVALIMELVEGGNLSERIHGGGGAAAAAASAKRRPSLSLLEVLQLGRDIAAGLGALHPCVVHRDLKPQVRTPMG